MTNSSQFYYSQTQSGANYSTMPSGKLDVNKLIAGKKAFWVSPILLREQKQKKLVLADWTASAWSDDKRERVKRAMIDLMDQRFSIYIWRDGTVIPLSKSDLSTWDHNTLKTMTMAFNEDIAHAAVTQNKLALDEIQVIDDYWLHYILSDYDILAPRVLRTSELPELTPQMAENLVNISKLSTPKLEKIIHDNFCKSATQNVTLLTKAKIMADVEYCYTMATLESAQDLCRVRLDMLTTLRISGAMEIPNVQAILMEAPQLKKLTLTGCYRLDEKLELGTHSLSQLEDIDLSHSKLSLKNLQAIVTAAPKLKKINFRSCAFAEGALELAEHSLSQLEDIVLNYSNLSLENLQSIVMAAPKLKKIMYEGSTFAEGTLDLTGHSLSQLEHLDLSYSFILQEHIECILAIAPKLKKINLLGCGILDRKLELTNHCLSQLEDIDLTSNYPSMENLQSILMAAQKLKKINLSNCSTLGGKLELAERSLLQIEDIDLKNSNLSLENLQTLLTAAPNLKKINLSHCKALDGKLAFANHSLLQIEDIDLNYSNLSLENLQTLLNAAPQLTPQRNNLLESLTTKPIEKPLTTSNLSDKNLINPIHDPSKKKNYERNKKPFEYKGTNTTKNHHMLIEKLSQYLTHSPQTAADIPQIQNGICNALAHYFKDLETQQWDAFIDKALAWDGRLEAMEDELREHFDCLYNEYVQRYYFEVPPEKKYIGDNLELLLTTQETCVLYNPWHAITIKRTATGWLVYDPNYVTGYLPVTNEKLLNTIHDAIGRLISVVSDNHNNIECKINNPDAFIAQGGLLALRGCNNSSSMLSQLPINHDYSKDALDGILLRGIDEHPAWVSGLLYNVNTPIKQFTNTLIKQFYLKNSDVIQQFQKSIRPLPQEQKDKFVAALLHLLGLPWDETQLRPDKPIHTTQHSAKKTRQYINRLKTWDKTAASVSSPQQYFQQCLNGDKKKRLIELDSEPHLNTLRLQLQQQAAHTSRPVFYIDNPAELDIPQGYIKRQDSSDSGDFVQGSGSALHAFLQDTQREHPVLIVNYDRFNSDHMVKYNALLDEKPNAGGTDLPVNTLIIGLVNKNKPNRYTGSDFYSRFDDTKKCPLTNAQLDALKSARTVDILSEENTDTTVINLYHATDWKDQLLGGWVLDGDNYLWKESQLLKAIKQNKPIEIRNGLWGDKAFDRFWNQVLSSKIFHEDTVIEIPHDMKLVRPEHETYEWQILVQKVLAVDSFFSNTADAKALNPTCLADFYERYELQARSDLPGDNTLIKKKGWLQLAQGQTLDVNLTRTLSDDAWARLLEQCNQFNVSLSIHCAPNVELPGIFNYFMENPRHTNGMPERTVDKDLFIISTDTDTTVAMLKTRKAYEVIDISECTPADLLVSLDATLNQQTGRFDFMPSNSALTTALAENKNIILKGCFSAELLDSLASLLLNRAQNDTASQLILVADDVNVGSYMSHRYAHTVSQEEKLNCLPFEPKIIKKLGTALEKESLSKLIARCHYLQSNPFAQSSDNAWIGMNSLPGSTQASTDKIDRNTSAKNSFEFTQARIASVNEMLTSAPYVFLTGLSGVGKSTFVEQELCKNDVLYQTEDQIEAWAKSHSDDKRQILFLDEANLSPRQWSEFEGLFNTPPTLLVNGVLYPLTEKHKVVFAGNPVNYGDERKLATFFQRHGHALLFTPLPPDVIYEKVLKPVFEDQAIDHDPITDRILDIYRFICECSTTELLISPRELQMMALLTVTRARKIFEHTSDKFAENLESPAKRVKHNPEQDIQQISEHISYELAKDLVPPAKRVAFDKRFKPDPTLDGLFEQQEPTTKNGNTFLVTPSRQRVSRQLEDLLNLRQWRRNQADSLNQAQKCGGLGGIIIEGAPGIGKSELVIAALIAHGYQEVHDVTRSTNLENPFYRMPVSMPLIEKEALLIKAFNEGAVVIVDEINSSPMMERLLNDLLMGKNPKRINGIIEKPGFMVIGTQNPATMAGRRTASTALLRRLISTQLPEYTPDEIKIILLAKGVNSDEADSMIKAYEETRAIATKNRLSPAPNFRNLIRLADDHVKSMTKKLPLKRINSLMLENEGTPLSSINSNHNGAHRFFVKQQRDMIKKGKKWLKRHQDQPSIQLDIIPIKQVGSLCKTVAIANVESYYAKKIGYTSIPLWSEGQETLSIRKLAKANGSSQGEILEFDQWRKTLTDLGFESEQIDLDNNRIHFVAAITDNLLQGNLPLIAFPVDIDTGLPNPETQEPEYTEHAAVISGYNWQTDEFTLVHWGRTHVVDATTLFHATHKLIDTRHQEFYTKNPAYRPSEKWNEQKYLLTTNPHHPNIARASIVPQKGTGFKAKLLIVRVPDEALLLQQREKLAHRHKAAEQTSVFKKSYNKLVGDRPGSSQSTKDVPSKKY
jgi:uncharacterized protein YjbI with pentapeptide repeats